MSQVTDANFLKGVRKAMNNDRLPDIKRFELDDDDKVIIGEIINLHKSLFIWIGDNRPPSLGALIVGMQTRFDDLPLTTTLITGDTMETELISNIIAKRLCKKLDMQVFVSSPLTIQDPKLIEKIIAIIIDNI